MNEGTQITTRNLIDIERYTNDIRTTLLASTHESWAANPDVDKDQADHAIAILAQHFDRATTKALFAHITQEPQTDALFRDKLHGSGTQASLSGGRGSRPGPKAGSKAAGDRARKAAETRRANKASRDAEKLKQLGVPDDKVTIVPPKGIPGTSSSQFGAGSEKGGA